MLTQFGGRLTGMHVGCFPVIRVQMGAHNGSCLLPGLMNFSRSVKASYGSEVELESFRVCLCLQSKENRSSNSNHCNVTKLEMKFKWWGLYMIPVPLPIFSQFCNSLVRSVIFSVLQLFFCFTSKVFIYTIAAVAKF